MRISRICLLCCIFAVLALTPWAFVVGADSPDDGTETYYDPWDNNPPGPPPNYNLIDSGYFHGVPVLPEPLENNVGGYYIYNDTAQGKWFIANHLFTRGESLEQFHGSILVIMDQPPSVNVNLWSMGFELSDDLIQNDRWGWVKWPDSIAENLYEIWWDHTIDYAKPNDIGDFRDSMAVIVSGCAVDFNLWASGPSQGVHFDEDVVFLGDDMTPLSDVPGFTDTYPGISDQYQVNHPTTDPNTSRFTAKVLPGASYNKDGIIEAGKCTYADRYAGSWAYEGNGIQFSTIFCPPNMNPNFVNETSVKALSVCGGEMVIDTIVATDPDSDDILTVSQLSGPGTLTSTPSTTPVTGIYELMPAARGTYWVEFEVTDGQGEYDTLTIGYEITISSDPIVALPDDTTYFFCNSNEICLPVDIIDPDCDIVSINTNLGTYSGTLANFDQVDRLNDLGGTVTQIGGGAPGTILYTAADFVPPVNSQSGVAVTLPNFIFADHVIDYGVFPTGIEAGNSPDYILNAPTDLTFTAPGVGGPDGGPGDGSVAFASGDHCIVGFGQQVTSCNGANADLVVFTNTNGGGTADIDLKLNGTTVYGMTRVVPGGSASSGIGGVTFDLPDGIIFNEIAINCLSGTLEIDAVAVRTAPSSTTADICFEADTAGVYDVTVTAEDGCGNVGSDNVLVTVIMNRPPVVDAGDDFGVFVCDYEEICFDVSYTDLDGNLSLIELFSGPGTLALNQICFTPTMPGAYTFVMHAMDACGLEDYDTVVVSVTENNPPVADNPPPVTSYLCEATELCHEFTGTDPDGGTLTWSHLAGVGTVTPAGQFCFTPTVSGTYAAAVVVSDSCGAIDTASIQYSLIINTPPVATDPSGPIDVFQCVPAEVCYQFDAADAEGGTLTWTLVSGEGSVDASGQWCFTPSVAGSYAATVAVSDSCGLADTTGLSYNMSLNGSPEIAFGNDSILVLCESTEICMSYEVTDPDGSSGLVEDMQSGFGTIDTANNTVCFSPTIDGDYEFIVSVVDSCGVADEDTVVVQVTFGAFAAIDCPAGPIDVSLCSVDSVCQSLNITPSTASVTVSHGVYDNGQLCFLADTSGTYLITVIAGETCGADTCQLTFNVEIGQAAQIDCPDPISKFICEAGTVCVPVGVYGSGAVVTVAPIGSYASGNLCFTADTAGHYEIEVVASTNCGTDTCLVVADIAINSAPVATDPATPVDTFLCASGQMCYQFAATDADGGSMTWSRLSGDGTVTSAGLWCFTGSSGTKSVTVAVTDSCGAADTTSLTYNLSLNTVPVVDLGADATRFVCIVGMVCQPYTITDPDGNVVSVELLYGNGTLDTVTNDVCFVPTVEGVYTFILKATDACGAEDVDTINVTIDLNDAPLVNAGTDQTLFQCANDEICWSVSAADPDGNLTAVELVEGPGVYNGSNICFTPTGTYNYEFVLKGTDDCGAEAFDTVAVYYTLNTAPVADAGIDQTVFQCTPTEICLPASCSDVDGNLSSCALVEGPGSYDGSNVCFTPGASGAYSFIIQAMDACGAIDTDTVEVSVTVNSAPVCNVPGDTLIFQCAAEEVSLPAFATDDDGNLKFCQITSGPGSLVGGNWCYTPVSDQAVTVTMLCEDSCGAQCESSFTVEFDINAVPTIAFGNDTTVSLCGTAPICIPYVADDADDPRPTTVTLVSGSGTLDEASSRVCFTPAASGTEMFVVRIEDECGAFEEDTVVVTIALNTPPVAEVGADQQIFLCDSGITYCWPASCSDIDGNLTDCIFNGPGLYDGSSICINPTASGNLLFTLRAIDGCGEEDIDSVSIDVAINTAPIATLGNDTSLFLCAPQPVCLTYDVSDQEGLEGLTEAMISGYGNIDTVANQVCFTPTSAGVYEFIVGVTDSCGATGVDTAAVTITWGDFAQIDCPAGAFERFLCGADSIVQMIGVSPTGTSVSASYGLYDDGALRFLADTSGTYVITMIADASCGSDTCVVTFNVTFNSAPLANAGGDQSLSQCAPTEVCWPASCSDVDGNLTGCVLTSGTGSYNGSQICFTPTASDSYEFILTATDECGAADIDTVVVDISLNAPPTITAQADTSLFLCGAQEVCVSYVPGDPDGLSGVVETMISGFGAINSAADVVCFTPTTAGTYEIIVGVEDPCGETAEDTVIVTVDFGVVAQIDCPEEPIDVFLCEADNVCRALNVTPASATVTVSGGTYANGELCFAADTAGTYNITVIASESCGADTCNLTFNVDIGEAAQIDCPAPQNMFICEVGTVCVPVGVYGSGAVVTVSPIGSFGSGNLCFAADTSGHYEIEIIAATDCGTDTCLVEADIIINTVPVATDPVGPVDTFMCSPAEVCYQFAANDVDGGSLAWNRVSGDGSVTSGGLWCFNSGGRVTKTVMVEVSDSCGAADTATLTYNITHNSAPVVTLGSDTTVFICDGGSYCFGYTVADTDDNVTSEQLVSGPGTIDTGIDEVCFTPGASGSYQFVVSAVDACGALGVDTVNVTVEIGEAVTVTCPNDTTMFLCAPQEICRPVGVSLSTATVTIDPIGLYSGGEVCFLADTSGLYTFTVTAESDCGSDNCSFSVEVTMNTPPVADEPVSPVDTFMCASCELTYQFSANDIDGGGLTWSRLSGNGTVDASGLWTFTASAAGQYEVCAVVTDDCNASDTVCLTYNVTFNGPPDIAFTRDNEVFLCGSEEICLNYTVTDPDDNLTLEQLVSGAGVMDTAANTLCFLPDTAGVYNFVIEAVDACGADDRDSITVTVALNRPPVADAGPDRTVFQCSPTQVCWPASVTDPDDNLDSAYVVGGVAVYDGGEICLTPDTAGLYTVILRAVDECGESDIDTTMVEIGLNTAPVCYVPEDTSFFQCYPTQVILPVSATDADNNFDHCEIITGPGSIVDGQWIFTPTADQTVTVSVMCIDDCGAFCEDSFTVSFDINSPPTADAGADTTYFLCGPSTVCWPVETVDPDDNLVNVELLSGSGSYDPGSGEICFNVPEEERSYLFVIKATDDCAAADYDTVVVGFEFNAPPTLGLPPDFIAYLDEIGEVCFDVDPDDEDGNLGGVAVAPFGTYNSLLNQICFMADSSGTYCMEVSASDACGASASDSICIQVVIDECIHVQLEKTHNAIQGQSETVSVFLNGSGKELGGFELLVAYDASALTLQNVVPGAIFENCGWEYLQFRFGPDGNCGSACPSGMLKIVGLAETNNGANHPGCFLEGSIGSLVDLDFLVSNDRTLECQYVPIEFFWYDCSDNAFSGRWGDTLWVSRKVYTFEHENIADNSYGFPGYFGAPDQCLIGGGPDKPSAIRCVDFTNGGIDIICADSIDARGDVNLNGVAYEVADAVVFSNYFVMGISAFNVNVDGQTAATDVNADGLTLSAADLVFLIRVVVGDTPPMPKLSPNRPAKAGFALQGEVLSITEASYRIGAISMTLEGKAEPVLHENAAGMQLRYHFDGVNTRVLVYNMNGTAFLETGPVLMIGGATGIESIEVGSFDGFVMASGVDNLPDHFHLAQNYPNPFNPTTTFEFALPVASDWELVVYNILGQRVQRWNGKDGAGFVKIHWDASAHSSGVYFYRLRAGEFSATKKMVMLK